MKFLARHPRGLPTLLLTTLWQRLGFYSLAAILTLYMDRELGWSNGTKGTVYGVFLALCYGLTLPGGWLGDRVLGPVRPLRLGGVLMTLGFVCLGCSTRTFTTPFLGGLVLIGIGTGIYNVNMSVLVGNLYQGKAALADAGFNIHYMGVNLGAALAPLLDTAIGDVWGTHHPSFWLSAACLVMSQWTFHRGLTRPLETPAPLEPAASLPPEDRRGDRARILAVGGLCLTAIFFWTSSYQSGFALTLFAEHSTRAYRLLRPETYQAFEPVFILAATPLMLAGLARMARSGLEPSTPTKILVGILIMAASLLVLVLACRLGGNLDQPFLSPVWLVGSYAFVTVAEILISPMGQSYVSRVAPTRLRGFMMGGWFTSMALGSYLSGWIGAFYGRMPHDRYFLLLTGLLLISALFILLLSRTLRQVAH